MIFRALIKNDLLFKILVVKNSFARVLANSAAKIGSSLTIIIKIAGVPNSALTSFALILLQMNFLRQVF
jgi:hypothetical protein